MKAALGADHAGFRLKDALKPVLDDIGVAYVDLGTSSGDSVDYPDIAEHVARGVARGEFERGILVCGSGIGMAIAANKVPGVRALVGSDAVTAQLGREHNDGNVLALGARLTTPDQAAVVRAFLTSTFEGGRHALRVDKIHRIEGSRTS